MPDDCTLIFSVIRRAMQLSNEQVVISEDHCRELYQFGIRQSVLSLFWLGIKDSNLSEEWKKKFYTGYSQELRRGLLREHSLKKIGDALSKAGIPYIFLKGSVLCKLYPEEWLRTSCDIDILVHEEDLKRAVNVLETHTDFKAASHDYHDISMLSGYFHLELHFTLKENDEQMDRLLTQVWKHAKIADDGSRYALTPEFQILHVICHMKHHFINGGLGVRPFIDLWLLRNKTQYNEQQVLKLCEECGIRTFYEKSCELADHWMEGKPIDGTLLSFSQYCLQGGVYGTEKQAFVSRQRGKGGFGYLISRVFVPDYDAREYYADPSGKQHGYFYYQIKRWKSWISRSRRQELARQTNAILSADKDEVCATRKLLKWLEI